MKREYTDPQNEPNLNTSAATAAAAIIPNHPHRPYSSPLHFSQHPFPSPDINSGGATTPDPNPKYPNPNSNDGARIETQRRPRGRPPGSKNKPKPPIIITRQTDPIQTPYILEIVNGVDIIDAVKAFARRRNTSLCILSTTGAVANLTIRQPIVNSSSSSIVTFHGRFDILSLSATFVSQSQIPNNFELNVAVSVSIPQGQIIGGIVAGELIASGTVYVIAASFCRPVFLRLPGEIDATSSDNSNARGAECEAVALCGGLEHY